MKETIIRRAILGASILLALMLVGVVFAEMLDRESALRWDAPNWAQTYITITSDSPITPTLFSLSGAVRLVDKGGAVVDSQTIEFSGCSALSVPGSGQCGSAYSWHWNPDDYAKGKGMLTEQVKISWIAPGYLPPGVELIVPWVPANCNLAGAGCTIQFNQSTWTVSIPESCRSALAGCGSVQLESGWWSISAFQGTKTWTWCLPSLVIGDTQ